MSVIRTLASTEKPPFPHVSMSAAAAASSRRVSLNQRSTWRRTRSVSAASDTYSARWSDAAYAAYRRDPARFAREHPDLEFGDTPHIGKACTYFCDERTHALLVRIPYQERLADLRVVRDAGDAAVAIQASLAQRTYFHPLPEPEPTKLTIGDEGAARAAGQHRAYCGGFIMPVVAQNLRRMLPATYWSARAG